MVGVTGGAAAATGTAIGITIVIIASVIYSSIVIVSVSVVGGLTDGSAK